MSSQQELPFSEFRAPSHWKDPEQVAEFERVGRGIGPFIVAFWRDRLASAPSFRMEELRGYVYAKTLVAPDSAGRILRDLRQKGFLNYAVVNRRASHYRALPIPHD